MDLDSLKERSKKLKAPPFGADCSSGKHQTVDDLIAAIKRVERKEYSSLKKAVPLWILAASLFLFSLVIALIPAGDFTLLPTLILKLMSVVLFLVVAFLSVSKIRLLRKIDYSENVRIFLQKAEKRFIFPNSVYWFFVFLLVILIAYGAHFYITDVLHRYFDLDGGWIGFGITSVFFSGVFVIGYTAIKSAWNKERTPLLGEIRRLQADLSSEE